MTWERRLLDVFEDLEQQAEGLQLAERDAELAERRHAEYSRVGFASRLHASVGSEVTLHVLGIGVLVGTLARVGDGWCLIHASSDGSEWVVRAAAVRQAEGLSRRAVSDSARPVTARLPLRAPLRRLAESRAAVRMHHIDGTRSVGTLARVGADFAELVLARDDRRVQPSATLLPFTALAAVRPE